MNISYTQMLVRIILSVSILLLNGCKKEHTFTVSGQVRWEVSGFLATNVHAQLCDTGDPLWDRVTVTSDDNGTSVSVNVDAPVGGVLADRGPTAPDGYYSIAIYRARFSGDPIMRTSMIESGRFWVLSREYEGPEDVDLNIFTIDMVALTPDQITAMKQLLIKEGYTTVIRAVPAPETWLKVDSGEAVKIAGALTGQLQRLASLKVKTWGRFNDKGAFEVQSYAIQETFCNGRRPLKGKLIVKNAEWRVYSDKPSEMIGGEYYLTDGREEVRILKPNNKIKSVKIEYPGNGPMMWLCGDESYINNRISIDQATRFGFLE